MGYALVHSALASRQAKDAAWSVFGARYRDGLYRFAFNGQAVLLFIAACVAFVRLPDRTLYRVPTPWWWIMLSGQMAGVGLMLWTMCTMGIARMTGFGPLWQLVRGRIPTPEPEAQGPRPGPWGEMLAQGPFRFTRHPANWGPLVFVLLFPHMTVNRATLAVLSVAYLLVGSIHEECRLRRAYGVAYDRYRRRVPFLVGPSGSRRRHRGQT
jgi:protein-S-isoprenylcysteine O-methyltransferase Ste14